MYSTLKLLNPYNRTVSLLIGILQSPDDDYSIPVKMLRPITNLPASFYASLPILNFVCHLQVFSFLRACNCMQRGHVYKWFHIANTRYHLRAITFKKLTELYIMQVMPEESVNEVNLCT